MLEESKGPNRRIDFAIIGGILAFTIGGFLLLNSWYPARIPSSNGPAEVPPPKVAVGAKLNPPPGYDWASANVTLLLALKVGCRFCEASMPFYQRLMYLANNHRLPANVVAVFPDLPSAMQSELREWLPGLKAIGGVSLDRFGVTGTPTAFVVGPDGSVRSIWAGRLSPVRETALLHELGSPL